MGHLLDVRDLRTQFDTENGVVCAVDGVSYHVDEGEIVGIVGESGCGKSVTQLSVLQLIDTPPGRIAGGQVLFEDVDLLSYGPRSPGMREVRGGKIGMIFQEPMTSLNPVLTIGRQITESLTLHLGLDRKSARNRAIELLDLVGIPDAGDRVDKYPHQFSGGMCQRVMIAMALCCNPRLLIADEATTALDVTTQAQLLDLLKDTVEASNTALILVTHNLGVVARYVQRVYVMYAGRIVETGTVTEIFENPRHPYTVGLLRAVPRLDEPKGRRLVPIDGVPPQLIDRPRTCAFLERCSRRAPECEVKDWPALRPASGGQQVACYRAFEECGPKSPLIVSNETERGADHLGPPAGTQSAPREPTNERAVAMDAGKAPRSQRGGENGDAPVLEVRDLQVHFPVLAGVLRRRVADLKAVDGVSFSVRRGETLGLVGESGCGKTTTARTILGLYRPSSGQVLLEGKDLVGLGRKEMREHRQRMSLVFQDPFGSLDPRQTAGSIVGEPLKVRRVAESRAEYRKRVSHLLDMVGLDEGASGKVPHEFSGGQRQRIGIARALACSPSLIVCDEPVSALDVSIQAQIVNLLQELQRELGLTMLFIAHDLSVVRHVSDRVAVMYLGRVVEMADSQTLYESPRHPYTRALLSAVPIPDPAVEAKRERVVVSGEVPSVQNPPTGCPFHPRCPLANEDCSVQRPDLIDQGGEHYVACSLL